LLVTMDGAVGAGRLLGAKSATLEATGSIVEQSLAFGADIPSRMVLPPAVAPDHFRHRLPFARQPRLGESRGRRLTIAEVGSLSHSTIAIHFHT